MADKKKQQGFEGRRRPKQKKEYSDYLSIYLSRNVWRSALGEKKERR